MLVADRMSRKVVAVQPQDTSERAKQLMSRHGFRHLPVLRRNRLVGILSDRDLRGAPAASRLVQDLMTLNPISTTPEASVDEAACVMQSHQISALPVVQRNRVVGILTTTGILRAFVDLSGAAEPTTRLILGAPRGRGTEHAVREVVQRNHGELKWLRRQGGCLHLRLKASRVDDIVTQLEAAGFDVKAVIASQREMTGPRRNGK